MADRFQVGGIILSGGRSRRMGTPKEWLDLDGQPMLARVVRIVGEVAEPVVVAARPNQALPPLPIGVEIVHDSLDDAGPLAGIEAAFTSLEGRMEAAFITPCDHPLLRPAFIRRLIDLLGDAPSVVLVQDGHVRPLPGIYRVQTLPLLRELLTQGERRVHVFAERCGTVRIPAEDLRDVDPDLDSLQNVNDAPQYAEAKGRQTTPRRDKGPSPFR